VSASTDCCLDRPAPQRIICLCRPAHGPMFFMAALVCPSVCGRQVTGSVPVAEAGRPGRGGPVCPSVGHFVPPVCFRHAQPGHWLVQGQARLFVSPDACLSLRSSRAMRSARPARSPGAATSSSPAAPAARSAPAAKQTTTFSSAGARRWVFRPSNVLDWQTGAPPGSAPASWGWDALSLDGRMLGRVDGARIGFGAQVRV
jgi:hypothetical protein